MGFDFDAAAAKGQMAQNNIVNAAASKPERKTVRINISLSEETNKKLSDYSAKTGISKSGLIQHWIHENCE